MRASKLRNALCDDAVDNGRSKEQHVMRAQQ